MSEIPAGLPGHSGGSAMLRRRPVRIVNGIIEGGYTDEWEVICPACGDTGADYTEVSPEIQAIRGPYSDHEEGLAALEHHMGVLNARTRQYYGPNG